MKKFMMLTEIHRIQSILLESRVDFLRAKYIEKLNDYSVNEDLTLNAREIFEKVLEADPDPMKKYSQWILNMVLAGQILKREYSPSMNASHITKVGKLLSEFMRLKNIHKIKNPDINSYRSLLDLERVVSEDSKKAYDEVEVLYDGNDLQVVRILTTFAAQFFGRDSDWCTAYGDKEGRWSDRDSHFPDYVSNGKLYIFIEKKTGKRWQLFLSNHPDYSEFSGQDNVPASPDRLIHTYPVILDKLFKPVDFIKWAGSIGLRMFDKEALSMLSLHDLAGMVSRSDDLELLPNAIWHDRKSVAIMLDNGVKIDPKYYKRIVNKLVGTIPRMITKIDPSLITDETLMMAAQSFKHGYEISNNIPRHLWTRDVEYYYWSKRARDGDVDLLEIPEDFRTNDNVFYTLVMQDPPPASYSEYETLVNKEVRDQLFKNSMFQSLKLFPPSWFTHDMVDLFLKRMKMPKTKQSFDELISRGDVNTFYEVMHYLRRIPPNAYSEHYKNIAKWLKEYEDREDASRLRW